jgi:hypothetical protein
MESRPIVGGVGVAGEVCGRGGGGVVGSRVKEGDGGPGGGDARERPRGSRPRARFPKRGKSTRSDG